jgi:hypothetical protein
MPRKGRERGAGGRREAEGKLGRLRVRVKKFFGGGSVTPRLLDLDGQLEGIIVNIFIHELWHTGDIF